MDRRPLMPRWCRQAAAGIFAVSMASFGLWYALRGMNWPTFRHQLADLDWRWLGLAVGFDISGYIAQGVRWHLLLERFGGLSLWRVTRAIYAGLFLNEMIPLRPGEAVRGWLAAREMKVNFSSVLPTMIAERLMDGVWLALALLCALGMAPIPTDIARGIYATAGAVAILVGLVFLWRALHRRNGGFGGRIVEAFVHPRAFAVSAAFLAAQGLAFWAAMRACHLPLTVLAGFVVMLVVRIGTMIPVAPANVGTHQFSTVLGLALYGVPRQIAAGFSVVVFLVLTVPLWLLGYAAILSAGVTWKQVRTARISA